MVRSLFAHLLSRDVERFKASLERASIEHQIRFGRLHDQQAKVVAEIYAKLLPVSSCFNTLRRSKAKDFTDEDRKYALKMLASCIEVFQYAHQQALYLDEALFQKIIHTVTQICTTAGMYTGFEDVLTSTIEAKGDVPEHRRLMISEALVASWRTMEDRITPLLAELKAEFQTLLGVRAAG